MREDRITYREMATRRTGTLSLPVTVLARSCSYLSLTSLLMRMISSSSSKISAIWWSTFLCNHGEDASSQYGGTPLPAVESVSVLGIPPEMGTAHEYVLCKVTHFEQRKHGDTVVRVVEIDALAFFELKLVLPVPDQHTTLINPSIR
jgi:hypothetical protein